MKKTMKFLLTVLLAVSLASCAKKPKDDIYVFYTSDVHCGVEENLGLAAVKALVDETRAEHEYVALVDAGDNLQGGYLGSLSKGKMIVEVMNQVGYDAVTFGNHEFDYGMEELAKRISEAQYPFIAANVRYTGSGTSVFADVPSYVIKDFDGTKVAFIGVLTPESITTSTPSFFMEGDRFVYDFYSGNNGQDLYDRVQEVVDELKAKKVDHIIVISHLGSTPETSPYDSISLISHTSGIEAVIDGHSHSMIVGDMYPNKDGEDVLLSSVGTKTQAVGELIIGKDGGISSLHIEQYDKKDETLQQVIAQKNSEIEGILAEKICDLDYDITMTDEEGIRMSRTREVPAGNFVADALRYAMGTDVAIFNGGGVRSAIPAGEITFRSLVSICPFSNVTASCYATGQNILDVLEFGARSTQSIYKLDGNAVAENGGFLQVSGLKFTIDTSVESAVTVDDNGMFAGFSGDQRRIKDVYVLEDGEYVPLDPAKTYALAGTNYVLFDRGDGNTILKDCQVITENGMVDVQALRTYVEDVGFGDRYRDVEGRINIE